MADNVDIQHDDYPNAGRASGYTDEQGRAIGEDLVNRITILMAGVETKILALSTDLRSDIAKLALRQEATIALFDQYQARLERLENRFDSLDERATHRDKEYLKRFDRIDQSDARTYQAIQALGTRIDGIERRTAAVENQLKESQADRRQIHAEIAELREMLNTLGEHLEAYIAQVPPTERAELVQLIRELVKRVDAIEQRLDVLEGRERGE